MSQNKILKDIALKLGGTVGKHDNDTNELLKSIAVSLGANPDVKCNNVNEALGLIRDNISDGGYGGESTLKKLLDSIKKTSNLIDMGRTHGDGYIYDGNNLCDIIRFSDTENVTDFSYMYKGASGATSFPLIDTSKGTNFTQMYRGCEAATSFPPLDTSNGTNFSSMFSGCYNVKKIDISHYEATDSSASERMFENCYNLRAIIIRSFGSSYVMYGVFINCFHMTGATDSIHNPNGDSDGYFYVPRDMIEPLSSTSFWMSFKTQLRALEDYTKDGTCWGEFDDEKAGLI